MTEKKDKNEDWSSASWFKENVEHHFPKLTFEYITVENESVGKYERVDFNGDEKKGYIAFWETGEREVYLYDIKVQQIQLNEMKKSTDSNNIVFENLILYLMNQEHKINNYEDEGYYESYIERYEKKFSDLSDFDEIKLNIIKHFNGISYCEVTEASSINNELIDDSFEFEVDVLCLLIALKVDLEGFLIHRYYYRSTPTFQFRGLYISILRMIRSQYRKKKKKPDITIGHIIEVIKRGKWFDAEPYRFAK